MKVKALTNITIFIILLGVAVLFDSCDGGEIEDKILVSEVPQEQSSDLSPWNMSKLQGARIVAISPDNKDDVKILTKDFYSAITPSVSYDGKSMLFAAKKRATDKWQIWQMNLSSGKSEQLTNCDTDCLNPSYLPINRFGFTKSISIANVLTDAVFTSNLDGTNMQQVTFSPQTFAALTTLKDGRFIAMQKQVYPEEGKQKLMVFRPDGTKLEFFYKSTEGTCVFSKPVETDSEEIFFIEKNEIGGKLVSLSYLIPLHSYEEIVPDDDGNFYSVANYRDNKLLTAFKKEGESSSALYEFDPSDGNLTKMYNNDVYHVMEAVWVRSYDRPKNLPSEVQLQEKAGLLMCQDVNFYGLESLKRDNEIAKAAKIELLGIDSTLRIVDVEDDGSFYIKIESDVPFRIQTMTANNEVVSGPGSWYYIRPNERRACVGCHTGPELGPFNRQPLSVRKDPVIITNNSELKLNTNMKDYEH